MNEKQVTKKLIKYGLARYEKPKENIQFTSKPEADKLLNDLRNFPHAYVLTCIMDRQIKAERAWLIPYEISCRLDGEFSMETLSNLTQGKILRLFTAS